MHEDSRGQTMNQVMTPFQQQFGKPCLCRATLSVWEKVCLFRGIWIIVLGVVDQYPERWHGAVVATFIERSPHKSVWKRSTELGVLHFTVFDERPGNEIILASVCNWTQRYWLETMLQSMCFFVGMISGCLISWESSLFRWMCSLLQLSILKCFLGWKRILITRLRCKTTHHTWW